jgi:hypothetical protein
MFVVYDGADVGNLKSDPPAVQSKSASRFPADSAAGWWYQLLRGRPTVESLSGLRATTLAFKRENSFGIPIGSWVLDLSTRGG